MSEYGEVVEGVVWITPQAHERFEHKVFGEDFKQIVRNNGWNNSG